MNMSRSEVYEKVIRLFWNRLKENQMTGFESIMKEKRREENDRRID